MSRPCWPRGTGFVGREANRNVVVLLLLVLLLLLLLASPKLNNGCGCGACAFISGRLDVDAENHGKAAAVFALSTAAHADTDADADADEDWMGEDWVSNCDDSVCEDAGGDDARIGEEDSGDGLEGRNGDDAKAGIIDRLSGDVLPVPNTGGIITAANMSAGVSAGASTALWCPASFLADEGSFSSSVRGCWSVQCTGWAVKWLMMLMNRFVRGW